jgi:hypothetical protein
MGLSGLSSSMALLWNGVKKRRTAKIKIKICRWPTLWQPLPKLPMLQRACEAMAATSEAADASRFAPGEAG